MCAYVRERDRDRERETQRERDREGGMGGRDGQTDGQMRVRETLVITIQLYKLLLWIKVPGKCTVCRGYSS